MNDRGPPMFGPYRLEHRLGRGGMGEVHRAYDTSRERSVALKRLRPHLAEEQDFRDRFRREALLAARLSSPHVVPIHDFGVIEDQLFIDMRLINGRDLGEVLAADGALPPARALSIVRQLAHALDSAHADGLVHRDVKPSNAVLADQRGEDFAYLVDFGIVRALGATPGTSLTETGFAVGTLTYMAPELFLGADADRRVDIYALGCLLVEALTGRPPFTGQGAALMFDHVNKPPPRLGDLRPGLPEALDDVVDRALAKDPLRRPSSAGELADDAFRALRAPSAPRSPAPESAQSTFVPRPGPTTPHDATPAPAEDESPSPTDDGPEGFLVCVVIAMFALVVTDVIAMINIGRYVLFGCAIVVGVIAFFAVAVLADDREKGEPYFGSAVTSVLAVSGAVVLSYYGLFTG